MFGNKSTCAVCGVYVAPRTVNYCHRCDPELKRRLTEAKLEALREKEKLRMEPETITPDEYVKLAMRTECEELEPLARVCPMDGDPLLPIRMLHAVLGMAGEAGEVAESVKKWVYYGRPLDRQGVVEELGDLLWYVALACDALRVPMSEVMAANIRKLKSRFPEKFTPERANDRIPDYREGGDTAAEREAVGKTAPRPEGFDPEVCVTCRYGRAMLNEAGTCAATGHIHPHSFVKTSQLERAVREREGAVAARELIRENFETQATRKVQDCFRGEASTRREPGGKRTRSQVLKEQSSVLGCCDRHADNQACDCLANALPDEGEG